VTFWIYVWLKSESQPNRELMFYWKSGDTEYKIHCCTVSNGKGQLLKSSVGQGEPEEQRGETGRVT
jgi:hypothetical protein